MLAYLTSPNGIQNTTIRKSSERPLYKGVIGAIEPSVAVCSTDKTQLTDNENEITSIQLA